MEIGDRRAQVVGAEVGPQGVDEAELGVGAFPQQEIGQPLLAAGADEEIDVAAGALPRDAAGRSLARGRRREPARGGAGDGVARGVVDRDPQIEAIAAGGGRFGRGDLVGSGRPAAGRGGR